VPRKDAVENERTFRRVPKSPQPVPPKRRSPTTKAKDYKGSGDEPMKFFGYERTDGVGLKDRGDDESGQVRPYSTNDGTRLTTADPTTVFSEWKRRFPL
jgi:hypothetical protein